MNYRGVQAKHVRHGVESGAVAPWRHLPTFEQNQETLRQAQGRFLQSKLTTFACTLIAREQLRAAGRESNLLLNQDKHTGKIHICLEIIASFVVAKPAHNTSLPQPCAVG